LIWLMTRHMSFDVRSRTCTASRCRLSTALRKLPGRDESKIAASNSASNASAFCRRSGFSERSGNCPCTSSVFKRGANKWVELPARSGLKRNSAVRNRRAVASARSE